MPKSTLKVVIPMAGLGTRLRPQTWSKPKQLISLAGKTVIDHVLDTLAFLPQDWDYELINIVGYLGEQIEDYIGEHYPDLKSHYIVQDNPIGQSHAVVLAREVIQGPTMVLFADTLIKADMCYIADTNTDAVAWVKPVPDPRRFGVAELGRDGRVHRLVEKPQDMSNNLALVGGYFFRDGEALIGALEQQIQQNLQLKGEFYLVDGINLMLEKGLKMRVCQVETWLDAGTPEALLETNRFLLEHGKDNPHDYFHRTGSVFIPPVFIHPSAKVNESIIGPNVSLGASCVVQSSIIRDSILEDEAHITGVVMENSLVGRSARLRRRPGTINAGDNSEVTI